MHRAEDLDIEARIMKAKLQMGILRHFFSSNDIKFEVKYWVYVADPLNLLLFGSELQNISEHKT